MDVGLVDGFVAVVVVFDAAEAGQLARIYTARMGEGGKESLVVWVVGLVCGAEVAVAEFQPEACLAVALWAG